MSDSLRLSTTSFAILGQLARGPWSAYDLAKGMQTNFDYFWPQARSLVFAEVKRLASLGLVKGRVGATGRRTRTVYSITPAGRRRLAEWLATPATTFALELEGLVRLFHAPFGTREDLLRALGDMQGEAQRMLGIARVVIPQYLAGTAPGQDEVHLRALLVDFLVSFAELVDAWSARSAKTVDGWSNLELDSKQAEALARIKSKLPRLDSAR